MDSRFILAAAAFAITLPAIAQTAPQAVSNEQAKPEKPKKVAKICRSEAPTGSHFSTRTCLTEQQWAARDAANGDMNHATEGGMMHR